MNSITLSARLCILGAIAVWIAGTDASPAAADAPSPIPVARSFDGKSFEYQMIQRAETDRFVVYRLTYPSPVATPVAQNNVIPADYYLPRGIRPGDPRRPAVVCLHILHGNFELVEMMCSALASRGVPALYFKLPYYGERSLPGGRRALLADPKLFVTALPQGVADVRRTIDLLASREEVDPDRIGLSGISLGGLVAATAAAEDPRVDRVALILAGGDLPAIVDQADEARALKDFLAGLASQDRAEMDQAIRSVDPLTHAAKLRRRARAGRVLMFSGTDDRVIPPRCARQLAEAMTLPADRLVWLEGLGHYTAMAALPRIVRGTVDFFAQDLPKGVAPPEPSAAPLSPAGRVAAVLGQIPPILSVEPKPGRCHLIDVKIDARTGDGQPIEATAQFVRGAGPRFRLELDLRQPLGVRAALGHDGACPWLASVGKAVFRGSVDPTDPPPQPFAQADPKHLLKFQMVSGAIAGAAAAPTLLERLADLAEETTKDGATAVRVTLNQRAQGTALLVFGPDGKSPARLDFDVDGVEGKVTFRAWSIDGLAHDALFAPPPGQPVTPIRQADVYHVFSALFDFLMEKVS
ncbi:MAG: prolyl oligopeptidase family serine peptidase [Pirellulales bacterium]|nr:prolyl oligopeptidase family serine peptidase [Pirellulales bacterium]